MALLQSSTPSICWSSRQATYPSRTEDTQLDVQAQRASSASCASESAALAAGRPGQGVPAVEGVQGPQGAALWIPHCPGLQVGAAPHGRRLGCMARIHCREQAHQGERLGVWQCLACCCCDAFAVWPQHLFTMPCNRTAAPKKAAASGSRWESC